MAYYEVGYKHSWNGDVFDYKHYIMVMWLATSTTIMMLLATSTTIMVMWLATSTTIIVMWIIKITYRGRRGL